jgi:hypothetical protein
MTVAKGLPVYLYRLDLTGEHEVRWEGSDTKPADEYTFCYGKGNDNYELGTVSFCA